MIETIYIARHGFRLSWETTIWKSITGTPRDPPLAAHGVDQAKELASWLDGLEEKERVQGIWSSPLYRCLETATPSALLLNLPINVEHGLGEWYLPVKKGLHPRSLPSEALKKWFPLINNDEGKGKGKESSLYPSQKGESIEAIHQRAESILRLLLSSWDSPSSSSSDTTPELKNVLLFTHAATNIALARALLKDRNADIRSGTCSIGKYRRIKGREGERGGLGAWESVLNGECGFLKEGEERHWEFSYVEEYEEDGILEDAEEGVEVPLPSEFYTSIPLAGTVADKVALGGKL